MMTPKASPKRTVTSIGSLAQLGALSTPNVQNSGSTAFYTRPVAHIAVPSQGNVGQYSQAPNVSNTPVAHPVGVVGVNLGQLQSHLSQGPTQTVNSPTAHISRPVNYPLRPEE